MPQKHVNGPVRKGGYGAHGGRRYASQMTLAERRKLPDALRSTIRSICCEAKCVSGSPHENGEQYCTACKEACCWMNK